MHFKYLAYIIYVYVLITHVILIVSLYFRRHFRISNVKSMTLITAEYKLNSVSS